jgi:hypothetical protein
MTADGGMCLVLVMVFRGETLHNQGTVVGYRTSTLIQFRLLRTM